MIWVKQSSEVEGVYHGSLVCFALVAAWTVVPHALQPRTSRVRAPYSCKVEKTVQLVESYTRRWGGDMTMLGRYTDQRGAETRGRKPRQSGAADIEATMLADASPRHRISPSPTTKHLADLRL
jgi:hypothetical protein